MNRDYRRESMKNALNRLFIKYITSNLGQS